MHTFWLVLIYDLLKDRRIDDVIIKTFLNSLLYEKNRFQVAVRLFSEDYYLSYTAYSTTLNYQPLLYITCLRSVLMLQILSVSHKNTCMLFHWINKIEISKIPSMFNTINVSFKLIIHCFFWQQKLSVPTFCSGRKRRTGDFQIAMILR